MSLLLIQILFWYPEVLPTLKLRFLGTMHMLVPLEYNFFDIACSNTL